jgi:hypothetical protein
MTRRTAILFALLLLTACDNQPPGPKLFEEQREELDQAKSVEEAQQQQAEEQQKAIEQQGQ